MCNFCKLSKNLKKHIQKYENGLDESEELSVSFSSDEDFDEKDCMDISHSKAFNLSDDKDVGDQIGTFLSIYFAGHFSNVLSPIENKILKYIWNYLSNLFAQGPMVFYWSRSW